MFSLDRIENDKAVLINENGKSEIVAVNLLPKNVREGDLLFELNGKYHNNVTLTKQKQNNIRSKLEKVLVIKKEEG